MQIPVEAHTSYDGGLDGAINHFRRQGKRVRTNENIRVAVQKWLKSADDEELRQDAIQKYGHIKDWDTFLVTDMSALFKGKYSFNEDISKWNTSNVTNMSAMFADAKSFNHPIGEWNVGNVTDMSKMFKNALRFNQPIGEWNVGNVTNMEDILKNTRKFKNWNRLQIQPGY